MGQSKPFAKHTVLVVEDEPLILMMAVDIVEDAGFEAIEAANADAALKVLEARADIDVLFTDIDMPGSMNGMALATLVRQRWPNIGVVIASGHVQVKDSSLPAGSAFFPKPYDAERLTRTFLEFCRN